MTKNNIRIHISLVAGILIGLAILIASGSYFYRQNRILSKNINSLNQKIAELSVSPLPEASPAQLAPHSPSPVTTTKPVIVAPLERALKVAAFLVIGATEDQKKNGKAKAGNVNMTDSELITHIALELDKDPAKLVQGEVAIAGILAEESKRKSQPAQNYPSNCYSNFIGETLYTHCY